MTQATPPPSPAHAYERIVVQNFFVPWTADLMERAAPQPGERALDLACGTGIAARSLVPLVAPGGSVAGLDLSPDMLEVARSLALAGSGIEYHEGSGTGMPFGDGSFDLVVCQQGLQFFPDHAAGLGEIHRVLAPGGRAVVSVWESIERQPVLQAVGGVVTKHTGADSLSPSFSLGDARLLERLASEAGFAGVDIQQVELTVRVKDIEGFLSMMLMAAAAVLPDFIALAPEERTAAFERMKPDIADATQRFIQGDVLVVDTCANVLTASR